MKRLVITALAAAALLAEPALAETPGVKAGLLTCNVASGWGFVFGSSKDLNCTYANGGKVEHYAGTVSKFGVDLGYTAGGVLVWAVLAPAASVAPGALAGDYAGVTGSAALVGGGGANVLVGGFNRSVALQPVSIEGYEGLNVAGGIAVISLHQKG